MKNHSFVLIILSLTLFINLSCDEDDKNNEPEQVEFTSTNYIYEGDLRTFYLQSEIDRLNADIEVWMQIPDNDPGYNEAQENIAAANIEIDAHQEEISSIPSPSDAFLIINPIIPPIPPSPSPCLCLDQYNSISNIVFLPGTDQLNLSILSNNDESAIVNTNNNTTIHTIPNTQNTGRYQTFEFLQPGFTGEATLNIQSDNQNYSILVYFQDLQ